MFQVMLGGEATVYRGHEGVREMFRDRTRRRRDTRRVLGDPEPWRPDRRDRLPTRAWQGKWHRDRLPPGLDNRVKNGKPVQIRTYLDPKDALEAAGLRAYAMSRENVELTRAYFEEIRTPTR